MVRSRDYLTRNTASLDLVKEFSAQYGPGAEVNLPQVPQFQHWDELVDARRTLPQTLHYPHREIAALMTYAKSCDDSKIRRGFEPSLSKALTWHKFECGAISDLPPSFFSTPPFMHPAGISFVALALLSHSRVALPNGPGRDDLGYLHVRELVRFPFLKGRLPSSLLLLASLDPESIRSLGEKDGLILSSSHALIKKSESTYTVFPRAAWDGFAADHFVEVRKTHDFRSFHALSPNLGWRPDLNAMDRAEKRFYAISTVSLIGIAIGLAFIALFTFQIRRSTKRIRELVMQTLTHELRTPVANMQYTIEDFRARFDELPNNLQDSFLSLCDDNQRLIELINASGGVLRGGGSQVGLTLPKRTFSSGNALVAGLIEPFHETISFIASPIDFPVVTDSYWLGVCLKNLIENAIHHGKSPVVVRLVRKDSNCVVSVEDQGTMHRRPFSRHAVLKNKSSGLGLGLLITREFTRLLGGNLCIRKRPHTAVSIQLPMSPPPEVG